MYVEPEATGGVCEGDVDLDFDGRRGSLGGICGTETGTGNGICAGGGICLVFGFGLRGGLLGNI